MAANSEQYKFQLDVICKNIQSADRGQRQQSLRDLETLFESNSNEPEIVKEIFDLSHLHILKCYMDKFESCRCAAINLINTIIPILPQNDYYLEYIVSIVARRIGQTDAIVEDSEEIRLLLIQQILKLLERFHNKSTDSKSPSKKQHQRKPSDPYIRPYNNLIDILVNGLKDGYHNVQRECCEIVKYFAKISKCFHLRAVELANPLMTILNHRQYVLRIAAIQALGVTALNIHSNGEILIKIIISISPLLMDQIPHVRRECGRIACRWLIELRDRYSFFERILPIVFCCLNDDVLEIRDEIEILWIKCGIQYYQENEQELSKLELVDEYPIRDYLQEIGCSRPTLGCRSIMQRSLRVIAIILNEMQDWKIEVRLHALKLLWQVVLHSEKALTVKFVDIYPILSKCCMDKEKSVVVAAVKVAKIMGKLLDYSTWIEYALNGLESYPNLGYLICFTKLFQNTPMINIIRKAYNDNNDIKRIAKIIADPSICHTLNQTYQSELLSLCNYLIELYLMNPMMSKLSLEEPLNDNDNQIIDELTAQYFHEIIVKIIALSQTNEEIVGFGKEILLKLAGGTNEKLTKLHHNYVKHLIGSIDDLESENSETSEPILLLHGIIWLCGFHSSYLNVVKAAINMILRNAKPEGKIKIFSAISVAMLKWSSTMNVKDIELSMNELRSFIHEIFEPCLVWHPGRSSESIRTFATVALCSMTQGAPEESYYLLPELSNLFVALIEDNNVTTRVYALRCLLNCGPIKVEQLKSLALGVLARLDDPSPDARRYATECISKLNPIYNDDIDVWETHIKHILSTLILHLDDSEIQFRDDLKKSIHQIGVRYKNVYENVVVELPDHFSHKTELLELLSDI